MQACMLMGRTECQVSLTLLGPLTLHVAAAEEVKTNVSLMTS